MCSMFNLELGFIFKKKIPYVLNAVRCNIISDLMPLYVFKNSNTLFSIKLMSTMQSLNYSNFIKQQVGLSHYHFKALLEILIKVCFSSIAIFFQQELYYAWLQQSAKLWNSTEHFLYPSILFELQNRKLIIKKGSWHWPFGYQMNNKYGLGKL